MSLTMRTMIILLIVAKPSASKKKFGEGCQSRAIASVSNLPDGIGLVRVRVNDSGDVFKT